MGKAIVVILLAALCACVSSFKVDPPKGCKTKMNYKGQECVFFGNLANNDARAGEILRSKFYATDFKQPAATVQDRLKINQTIFAPYYSRYAIYESFMDSLFQSDPKGIEGFAESFDRNITEVYVIVKSDTTVRFVVKGHEGFQLSWKSDRPYDVATSQLCIGHNNYTDEMIYYFDCPIGPEEEIPEPEPEPQPTPSYNQTITVNITAKVEVHAPPGTNVVVNLKPEIQKP